jgi:ceramide glucosyltransferase
VYVYWLFAALTCGSLAYCAIAAFAAIRFRRYAANEAERADARDFLPPVSILKPVYGADRDLEANLRSFFLQDYTNFEVLFSARDASDPAVSTVSKLQQEFPLVRSQLLLIGNPKYLNAKVHGMEAMMEIASHEFLVISDSDVRVATDYLRRVVSPFRRPEVGLTTVLSIGVPGESLWSRLEILGMNTQFIPGVLTAWFLLGVEFALGPTMAIRKSLVREIGGFGILRDYLADDFVLGEKIARLGREIEIAATVPEHLVFNDSFAHSLTHRLRWERSSRRSRPAGYFGQVFMHSIPLAAITLLLAPSESRTAIPLLVAAFLFRYLLAGITTLLVLADRSFLRSTWLLPAQDVVGFLIWVAALFGKHVTWRGERFAVLRGGRLERGN